MQEQAPTFKLDTSGFVGPLYDGTEWRLPANARPDGTLVSHLEWSDLDPFTQGYVEALFKTAREANGVFAYAAFSDLAPETLARIVEDCAKEGQLYGLLNRDAEQGRAFWTERNTPRQPGDNVFRDTARTIFPPQTAYLGDDGKVYLREAV